MAGRDAKPAFPVGPFYTRDARMFGFAMFNAPADEQRKAAAEINRWLARGRLRPQIDRVMKLSEAAEAHKLQEASTTGKKSIAGRQDRAGAVESIQPVAVRQPLRRVLFRHVADVLADRGPRLPA